MTGALIKREETSIQTKGHVHMEAGFGVIFLKAKDRHGLAATREAGRGGKDPPLEPSEEAWLYDNFISDFWCPGLWENIFCCGCAKPSRFLLICCGGPKKLMQYPINLKIVLFEKVNYFPMKIEKRCFSRSSEKWSLETRSTFIAFSIIQKQ